MREAVRFSHIQFYILWRLFKRNETNYGTFTNLIQTYDHMKTLQRLLPGLRTGSSKLGT